METVTLEYKGCVITHPRTRMMSDKWTVNVASNDRLLMAKLGRNQVFDDGGSLEGAIAKAKQFIDTLQK